jgi:hypothetical protein
MADISKIDTDAIKTRITFLSGIPAEEIEDDSLDYVLEMVVIEVLAFTNRELLNEPLTKACQDLCALNWVKQWFLSEDAEGNIVYGDILSISEGDTRIGYQNRAQVEGIGASWGSYKFMIENIQTILNRYRRLHWGSARDIDYG